MGSHRAGHALLILLVAAIHLAAALLLILAVVGPRLSLLTITASPETLLDDAPLISNGTQPQIWISMLGACWRKANGTERCQPHSFQPTFNMALSKFNFSQQALAVFPARLNGTPPISLFSALAAFVSFFLMLLGLAVVHVRQPEQAKLRFGHPRLQLGLLAARWLLVASLVFSFASFFFGITAALSFEREFAQIRDAFNAVSSTLPAGVPDLARTGTTTTIMFVGCAFLAVSFFATTIEYIQMPREPQSLPFDGWQKW